MLRRTHLLSRLPEQVQRVHRKRRIQAQQLVDRMRRAIEQRQDQEHSRRDSRVWQQHERHE